MYQGWKQDSPHPQICVFSKPHGRRAGHDQLRNPVHISYGGGVFSTQARVRVAEPWAAGLLMNPMGSNFVFQGAMDLCYQRPAGAPFSQMLRPMTLMFDSAEITPGDHQLRYQIPKSNARNHVPNGLAIYCFTFGNSDLVPVEANIIGNRHQQNLWIEYDLQNSRIGFGRAHCKIS